ncbi:thiamine-phosphate pyrophosphorylase [Desulfatibacillum alkenivorans DSM 16219]|jgi:thiamine-phosphate pyrophosphorylase|uniref:Thiamine-phosphate synthase n=1 Tax=Desulfatibacillum alkenivorans DSM 16219 TaxID=1121393 RepID=A0A1M6HQC3_9BACT|nr:thiamine phosphate synthase [Desulfatibacillum alkenivorans]SHJ24422.1 thiamine-phosphate pyrophosphorylase [Desulfatibacillum alkenivorans DSM 16219]
MKKNIDYSLYLVTDRPLSLGRDLMEVMEKAAAGGATIVQLREKECDSRTFVELARAAKSLLDAKGVPLIINDRADIALAVGAAGLHIGQTDMPYKDARRIMGPEAIVGLSVENMDQVKEAAFLDADYLGVGPIFATQTKPDAAPAIGLEGLAEIRRITKTPLIAIGSVNLSNAADVIRAGADGLAVVSAICSQPDIEQASRALAAAIQKARQ